MIDKMNEHYSMTNPASVYDEESLTALELAAKTTGKVNECVRKVNEIPNKIEEEVQKHIDDGAFDKQINEYAGDIKGRVDNLLGSVKAGSTTMDAEIIDGRVGVDGTVYPNIGSAIRLQCFDHYRLITDSGCDFNKIVENDSYVIGVTDAINNPLKTSGMLFVENVGKKRWIKQTACPITFENRIGVPDKLFIRYGHNTSYNTHATNFADGLTVTWGEWIDITKPAETIRENGVDLNTFVETRDVVIGVTDAVNRPPISGGCLLTVRNFTPFIYQEAVSLGTDSTIYYRYFRTDKDETSGWKTFPKQSDIDKVVNDVAKLKAKFVNANGSNDGYKIVNFGDSITDYVENGVSISSALSELTGATCYNVGFGGCRMSPHSSTDYLPYSMCELADAIASNNFTAQMSNQNVAGTFPERVETLMSIDFSKVDIITIGYGTNDFTASVTLENSNNKMDKSTFAGALRYSIETLLNAYPNLRIVIVAPTYRCWYSGGKFSVDSDTHKYGANTLINFVDKCVEIGKEYHIPVCNPYYDMGINKFNRLIWFRSTNDGTHPGAEGKRMLAKQIAKTIKYM